MSMKKISFSIPVKGSPLFNFKKKLLAPAVLVGINCLASPVNADLASGTLGLEVVGNLNPACLIGGIYPSCSYGVFDTADAGSFFTMNDNPASAIDGGPVHLRLDGIAQNYNGPVIGSAPGESYAGGNVGPIADWNFFGNLGTNSHAGLVVFNNDTAVDMSTWLVNWGPVPIIDMGGPGGVGTLACTGGIDVNACEQGESFTLDYAAVVPAGDPSGFGGVAYGIHLEGFIRTIGPPPITSSVKITGIVQPTGGFECLDGGVQISAQANVATADVNDIAVIEWALDSTVIGVGASINILVPLGTHGVSVAVTTIESGVLTAAQTVSVVDTKPPVISSSFVTKRGDDDDEKYVTVEYSASDACDSAPVTSATLGIDASSGDILKTNGGDKKLVIRGETVTSMIKLTVDAVDVSGNTSMDSKTLNP